MGDALGHLFRTSQDVAPEPAVGSLRTGGATELGLFTLDGLIRMLVRYFIKGIGPAWVCVGHAYHRWLYDKRLAPERVEARWKPYGDHWPDGWLAGVHALHRPVEGFATTIEALSALREPNLTDAREFEPRVNKSDGSGGVVRAGAAGLVIVPEWAFEAGARSASFTHGGAAGYLSAGYVAAAVARLVSGLSIVDAFAAAALDLANWPHSSALHAIATAAVAGNAPAGEESDSAKALGTAVRVSTAATNVIDAVTRAAREGGTAAAVVTGYLVGAHFGILDIPGIYRTATDLSGVIEQLGDGASVAHRRWVMHREIPGAVYKGDDLFEGDPVSDMLWTDFPGW